MPTPQSSFIIKQYKGWGGNVADSQYLGAAYNTGKPHVFENTNMRIYSAKSDLFASKPLMGMTGAKSIGNAEIPTELYRWYLQGAEEKSARSIENLESSNAAPGLNNTAFRIKLDLDFYSMPDVLFGEDNEYPLSIVDGPIPDGTGFVYIVKIQGDNPSTFFPNYYMDSGREFNKVWTSVPSEFNQWGGTQQYPSAFQLESQVGAFAQEIHVTDKAWRDQGRMEVEFTYTDMNGKVQKATKFLAMAEAKMWDELYMSMEAQLTYGKRSTQPGPDKYWTKTGPGMREQLKDGWIEYYNGPLTVNRIKDYLMDIFFTRENETSRKVVAMTGTLGSLLFHDALVAVANGFLTVDTHFIEKIASPVETPHLAYGAQFTRYRGPEGVVVDLIKNPLYDSRKYCKRTHPNYPEYPIDSARLTFLDFGSVSGENNITMVKVKDTYYWGYVPGSWTPSGPVKGGVAGAHKNGYSMFTGGTAGLWIKDVTRCGELVYDFEF
jgi:hypothetical protein